MWSIPPENPEGRAFIAVLIVFLVIAYLACGLRVYSRRLGKSALDASDYMCFLAVILDVFLIVIIWSSYAHGYGQNITQFTAADNRFSTTIYVSIDMVWNGAVTAVRISMVLLYIRIFPVNHFKIVCWIVVAINIAGMIAVVLATCLICKPISYYSDKTIPGGHCGNLPAFILYMAVVNLLLDFMVVILPLPMLWKLQMKTKRKIELSIVFGMGLIIVLLTLVRVLLSVYDDPHNFTKEAAFTTLVSGLEPTIGVINACLPFMPLVAKRIGQTYLYQRASASIQTLIKRRSRSNSAKTSDALGASHPGLYEGLSDIEMNPIKDTNFVTNFATSNRQDELESQPLDNGVGQDRILVLKDYTVKSESQ